MTRTTLTYGFFFLSLSMACSRIAAPRYSDERNKSTAERRETKREYNAELQSQLSQIASAAKGRVGVAALVLETGETVSLNPHDHFPMQSVYKLPIGMAVMKQVDAGKVRLDQKVRVTKDDFIGRAAHSPIRDTYANGSVLS